MVHCNFKFNIYTPSPKFKTISVIPLTLIYLPFKKGADTVLFIISVVIFEIGVYTATIKELLYLSTLPRFWEGLSGSWWFSFAYDNKPIYSPRSTGNPHSYNTEGEKEQIYIIFS